MPSSQAVSQTVHDTADSQRRCEPSDRLRPASWMLDADVVALHDVRRHHSVSAPAVEQNEVFAASSHAHTLACTTVTLYLACSWIPKMFCLFVYWGFRARRLLGSLCAHNVRYARELGSTINVRDSQFGGIPRSDPTDLDPGSYGIIDPQSSFCREILWDHRS